MNMALKEPILNIQNLNHTLGEGALKKQVLWNINLQIYSGEFVILTGPSGSGKSTLLTIIGGLRSIQNGSLKILDQELNGADNRQLLQIRRQIGYIFQGHNLLPFLTAVQNVQTSIMLHKDVSPTEAYSRSVAMLEAVSLGSHVNSYPRKLSGGQQQRVAIARALVTRPKLIVADEPTAALDKKTGRDVVDLMRHSANQFNCAILMVTHDNRISDAGDKILHMEDGSLMNEAIKVY